MCRLNKYHLAAWDRNEQGLWRAERNTQPAKCPKPAKLSRLPYTFLWACVPKCKVFFPRVHYWALYTIYKKFSFYFYGKTTGTVPRSAWLQKHGQIRLAVASSCPAFVVWASHIYETIPVKNIHRHTISFLTKEVINRDCSEMEWVLSECIEITCACIGMLWYTIWIVAGANYVIMADDEDRN